MKKLSAGRWVAFLMMLLANADAANVEMMIGRSLDGLRAKSERCGQTGPTVPSAPVVFRMRATIGPTVPQGLGNVNLGAGVRDVRSTSAVPAQDEFLLGSARPAVRAVFTR